MLTLALDPQRAHFSLRTGATVAFILIALVPPLLVLTVLWIWPIAGLTADRTAMAARDYTDMWAAGHFIQKDHVFTSISCPGVTFCMAADTGGNMYTYSAG